MSEDLKQHFQVESSLCKPLDNRTPREQHGGEISLVPRKSVLLSADHTRTQLRDYVYLLLRVNSIFLDPCHLN